MPNCQFCQHLNISEIHKSHSTFVSLDRHQGSTMPKFLLMGIAKVSSITKVGDQVTSPRGGAVGAKIVAALLPAWPPVAQPLILAHEPLPPRALKVPVISVCK